MIAELRTVLIALLALIFLSAAWAPLEALGWWAGWIDRDRSLLTEEAEWRSLPPPSAPAAAGHFAVFLTGIAAIGGETVLPQDRSFLERLRAPREVSLSTTSSPTRWITSA